eukprot:scaffold38884_cov66-Attheya_sp.AAC.7
MSIRVFVMSDCICLEQESSDREVPVYTIMLASHCWSSDAFLRYIQKQVKTDILSKERFFTMPDYMPSILSCHDLLISNNTASFTMTMHLVHCLRQHACKAAFCLHY